MLYKKYHKDYVRKFKKGAKVVLEIEGGLNCVVDFSPTILSMKLISNPTLSSKTIVVDISESVSFYGVGSCRCVVLVDPRGRLNSVCYAV